MTSPTIAEGRQGDRAGVEALLTACGLPLTGLDAPNLHLIVAREDDRLVGCAAIERFGTACVLRSLAVSPDRRGSGLARRLIDSLLHEARAAGSTEAYLLTKNVQRLASRYGFMPIPRERVSPQALASPEFGLDCCSSASVMLRLL